MNLNPLRTPPRSSRSAHRQLDELKRLLALAVVRQFTPREIRAQSLAAMLGRDEDSNRLRQSPPYVGLLSRDEVKRLNEAGRTHPSTTLDFGDH